MSEEDPAAHTYERISRTAVMAAQAAAQLLAQRIAERRRQQAAADQQQAAQIRQKLESDHALIRAQVKAADDKWLARAGDDQVLDLWKDVQAWTEYDPGLEGPSRWLGEAVAERQAAAEDRDQAQNPERGQDRDQGREGETSAEAAADKDGESLQHAGIISDAQQDAAADADQGVDQDRAAEHEAAADTATELAYDSDDRRAALADRMIEGGVDMTAVDARVRASEAQARPGREATSQTARRTRLAKQPGRSAGRNSELER